jgi:hypothetical protein
LPVKPSWKSYDLEGRGKYWQHRLRLDDWEIRWMWLKGATSEDGAHAHVRFRTEHRRAEVQIYRDFDPSEFPGSLEYSIVHELIHCMLTPFCNNSVPGEVSGLEEEHVVGALAEALTGHRRLDPDWRKAEEKDKKNGKRKTAPQ